MKKFEFKYKATFEGTVEIRANSRKEAKEILERDFGGLQIRVEEGSNVSYASAEEGVVDWDFDSTPTKTIIK